MRKKVLFRSCVAFLPITIVMGCDDRADPATPVDGNDLTQSSLTQSGIASVTFDPDTLAARLRRVGNENELIIWTKSPTQAPPSPEALQAGSSANTVVGVPRPAPGKTPRGNLTLSNPRAETTIPVVAALAAVGVTPLLVGRALPVVVVRIPDESLATVTRVLLQNPSVDWVEANQRRRAKHLAGPLGINNTDTRISRDPGPSPPRRRGSAWRRWCERRHRSLSSSSWRRKSRSS